MQFKHIVLILFAVAYTGYYVGVSKGLINKEAQYGNEDEERTSVQKVVDAITPDSPAEKRMRNQEDLDELNFQLNLANENYESTSIGEQRPSTTRLLESMPGSSSG